VLLVCDLCCCPQAVALRYGEPRETDLLTRLAGALTASLSPHWLGLIDLNGYMGLQKLIDAAAPAGASKSPSELKQRVEMTTQQLPALSASAGTEDGAGGC